MSRAICSGSRPWGAGGGSIAVPLVLVIKDPLAANSLKIRVELVSPFS